MSAFVTNIQAEQPHHVDDDTFDTLLSEVSSCIDPEYQFADAAQYSATPLPFVVPPLFGTASTDSHVAYASGTDGVLTPKYGTLLTPKHNERVIDSTSPYADTQTYSYPLDSSKTTSKAPDSTHNLTTNVSSIADVFDMNKPLISSVHSTNESADIYVVGKFESQTQCVLKQSDRNNVISSDKIVREATILGNLNYRNIVKLDGLYASDSMYHLATPYCAGGSLLERIAEMDDFSERDCADFVEQILFSLEYMHTHKTVHRDINFENILFDRPSDQFSTLTVVGFGHAMHIQDHMAIDKSASGSLLYMAPEMSRYRLHSELFAADVWSVGVMVYAMMQGGHFPVVESTFDEMMARLNEPDYALNWRSDIKISESCKDFIGALLMHDPDERLTAEGALQHPWMAGDGARSTSIGKGYKVKVASEKHGRDETIDISEGDIDAILDLIDIEYAATDATVAAEDEESATKMMKKDGKWKSLGKRLGKLGSSLRNSAL